MPLIYQWSLSNMTSKDCLDFTKEEVFANETPAQYKAATPSGYFIGFRRTLSKTDMDTISVPSRSSIPVYSSLNNDESVALDKLKEWYNRRLEQNIVSAQAIIDHCHKIQEQLKHFDITNDQYMQYDIPLNDLLNTLSNLGVDVNKISIKEKDSDITLSQDSAISE